MQHYIKQLYSKEFLPRYLSETLEFDRDIFSQDEVLSIFEKEKDSFQVLTKTIDQVIRSTPQRTLVSGTGSGALSSTLIDCLGLPELIEVDINPQVIERRKKLNNNKPNRHAVIGDIQNLEFPDENFDLSVAYAVLRYTAKPEQALKELVRTLRVKGWLVIGEGRKQSVVDKAATYLSAQYATLSLRQIKIDQVLLPNLTFAYFLIERYQKNFDPQLKMLVNDVVKLEKKTHFQVIFDLAESTPGTIYLLFVQKN